jgi:GntR family transcriptional regulator
MPSALRREHGTSLHRQLFMVVREQIARGAYAASTALPTEEALCEQFGVSRITVRRALQDLESEGFVERRHGRGTYVLETAPTQRMATPVSPVGSFRKLAQGTKVDVIEGGTRAAPAAVAGRLGISPGDEAIYALRVRRRGDVPLMVVESWLPASFARTITLAALRKHAMYELLLKAGVAFGRVLQELSAETADPIRAQLLRTDIGAPLIRITRLIHDTDATPIQRLTVHLSPERSRIVMDIAADRLDSLDAGYIAHDVAPLR